MLAKYPRPDNIGYDAFPSGHTTMAFTSATLLHQEYGHRSVWYSVGGYGTAVSVGTLRMLNNRHWLSDVLFGAGVGIGATKAVYYMYPRIKRKITKRRQR
jgi:membrane-associated phospholipid phosphatase